MKECFAATLSELKQILAFIREHAKQAQFDENVRSRIELAMEEALVNIMQHGYPEGEGAITVTCESGPYKGLVIQLEDEGVPYNPLLHSHRKLPSEQEAGGYGVYLMVQMMDEVRYKRENGKNILTLKKDLPLLQR